MYTCKLETMDGVSKTYAASDYRLIGHPKYYEIGAATLTVNDDTGRCTVSTDADAIYFDKSLGLCYGIKEMGTGEFTAYHVSAFGYNYADITVNTANPVWIDPGKLVCKIPADDAGAFCTASYQFNIGLRRWMYICSCNGGAAIRYYAEAGASPSYTAVGYEKDKTWTCDGDSLDILDGSSATSYCKKGEFYLTYDNTN